MNFQIFGNDKAPTLLLIPGLGVSYEIFLPLIRLTEEKFRIIAVEVGGFRSEGTLVLHPWTIRLRKSSPI